MTGLQVLVTVLDDRNEHGDLVERTTPFRPRVKELAANEAAVPGSLGLAIWQRDSPGLGSAWLIARAFSSCLTR